MYARTGQALALGLVGLAIALPTMILALPAGYLADRFNRRTVMMLSLTGTTLTSLGIAAVSWKQGPIALMYALLVVDAAITVLGAPARRAIVPQLVPARNIPQCRGMEHELDADGVGSRTYDRRLDCRSLCTRSIPGKCWMYRMVFTGIIPIARTARRTR